jgi:hypothetical protein
MGEGGKDEEPDAIREWSGRKFGSSQTYYVLGGKKEDCCSAKKEVGEGKSERIATDLTTCSHRDPITVLSVLSRSIEDDGLAPNNN